MATTIPIRQADIPDLSRIAIGVETPDLTRPNTLINIVHELGSDLNCEPIRKDLIVSPSNSPTLVSVQSRVVTESARGFHSPQYLATIRRRKSNQIKTMFAALAKKDRRDDFHVYTTNIFENICELLFQLTEAPREGNTREILRLVRDGFLDDGFNRYREAKARDLAASIFDRLSSADEVTPDDVDQVWDEIDAGGLSASIPPIFIVDEGDAETDD